MKIQRVVICVETQCHGGCVTGSRLAASLPSFLEMLAHSAAMCLRKSWAQHHLFLLNLPANPYSYRGATQWRMNCESGRERDVLLN